MAGSGVDERLDTLLDTEKMRDILAPIVKATHGETARIGHLGTEVLRRRSKRCVIRYPIVLAGGATTNLIGKVFKESRGELVYLNMKELWRRGFARSSRETVSMPEPLAYHPELGLLVQEEVPGPPMGAALGEESSPRYMRQLARVLIKLHSCGFAPGEPFGVSGHLTRCRPDHRGLCLAVPELEDDIELIVRSALEIEKRFGDAGYAAIHGDFHMGQVHVQDGRSWLIDFDALSFGDPAADLGNVLVFIKGKSRSLPNVPELVETLLDEYFQVMDPEIAPRIPLYEGLTHLRRACKRLRLQRPRWQRSVKRMIAAGVACIESM